VRGNTINLSVYERGGVGLIFACESGACATFAAGLKVGIIKYPCEVNLEHGTMTMAKENGDIIMQGGATLVSTGDYFYE